MARVPVLKVMLDVFPCTDENGVRTGSYGTRLWNGPNVLDIPAEFKPVLVAGSTTGEAGSGAVEGVLFLKYGGAGDCPAELAEWQGRAVHALKWSGPNGMTIPMDMLIAIADSMLPIELYSKRWLGEYGPVANPADPDHPYADVDNDGKLNWQDLISTDGPGWETPEPNDPEEPETPEDPDPGEDPESDNLMGRGKLL